MSEQINADAVAIDAAAAVPQFSVGEQLRAAREARGLQIADIAQTLKLGPRQVEALENGDWHGLPGQTFIRGFVRNYARLLQLDAAPLMALLDGTLEKPADTLAVKEMRPAAMPHAGSASRRDRHVVLLGMGLVVLAALAYFLMPNDLSALRNSTQGLLDSLARKEEAAAPAAPAAPAPAEALFPPGATPQQIMNPQAEAPAETPVAPTAATPAVAEPAAQAATQATAQAAAQPVAGAPQMRFVFDKESWLEVRDRDNKVIFSQRVAAGSEQTLAGHGPLSLVVGYAPGVRLFWRGQAVDLAPHTRADVARLVLE